jgi:hypothetical protein
VLARRPVRVARVDLHHPAVAAVVHRQEVRPPAVAEAAGEAEVGPVLLGRHGGAPGGDAAGAVGERPVGPGGHRRPYGGVAGVADTGAGHADAGAGGGDPAGEAAVTLQLPGAVALALDADHRAADGVLLQLDLLGGLGRRVPVAVDEERVGVLVVDPQQPSLVALSVLQREVGDEGVVVAEALAAADGVAVGGDHVVGEPVGQGHVVDEQARLAGPALRERRRPAAACLCGHAGGLLRQRRTGSRQPADQRAGRGQPLDEHPTADPGCGRQLALLQHSRPPGGAGTAPRCWEEPDGRRLAIAVTLRSAAGRRLVGG